METLPKHIAIFKDKQSGNVMAKTKGIADGGMVSRVVKGVLEKT